MMRQMPPAVVPLLLVALGVPAAFRAAIGRPRALGTAWVAAIAAAAVAQVIGELSGSRLAALIGTVLTSTLLAWRERASG
jgi:hypothetical protein